MLIFSSQESSLNTYNWNLRKLVDHQLPENRKTMHFPFFFFKMCAHICFFELVESVWERKKVILKCAFELVQKLVWEQLKKSSAQNVEILLISSSQKTSLNTHNSNLRELIDKQLLEIKKKHTSLFSPPKFVLMFVFLNLSYHFENTSRKTTFF